MQEFEQHVNSCIDTAPTLTPVKKPRTATAEPLVESSTVLKPLSLSQRQAVTPDRDEDPKSSKAEHDNSDGVFSKLMNSHKENEAWKEATIAEDRNFRPTKANGGRRQAPFYKVMQGMPIAVDAFRYGAIPGVTAYFLTLATSLPRTFYLD